MSACDLYSNIKFFPAEANNSNSTNGSRNGTDVTDLDFVMNSTTPVCKIPCSVDFCRDNRNRICSANRSAMHSICLHILHG